MARAISADDTPETHQAATAPMDCRPGSAPGSGPLLEVIAVQRSVPELAQLATILKESDRPAHAQEMLDTAATVRPVQDVVELLPLLAGDQAAHALRSAAAGRPVAELAHLVQLLNESGQTAHAQEALNTAATARTVEDVAAMIPLLGSQVPANVLHSAAATRPVEELAQLVGHLDQAAASEPDAQQLRRRRHR